MSPDDLLTRDEVLGGLPAKRAATLLFLIESRTAHLVDRSRRAMEFFLTEDAAHERELAFLEAFSLGRDPPLRPTIQDLERYAPQWVLLVPDNPQVQAALAHLLGQKYRFTAQAVPGIRTALGLNEAVVQQAYQRLYREPLEKIYLARPTLAERLRWAWAAITGWQEALSPFWTAVVLILAMSLPPAFLALPIAVAHVGPLSGLLFLVVIGLLNVLTMACMAEACARSGSIRYGKAFMGRLVSDFLGGTASSCLSLALAIRTFLALLAACFALAMTMMTFTGVPAEVWIGLLFLFELWLLSRGTPKVTVTALVLLAVVNILLLLPILFLGFSHLQTEFLTSETVPLFAGEGFDPQILRLVFGVILLLYFGHVYVVHCAKLVLPRDPGGRSLIRGSVAGTATLTALVGLWIFAVGGAISPQMLAVQTGTALTPLADRFGAIINVLGSGVVIFFLGMSVIRCSNVLFNLVHERLPTRLRSIVTLPRRRGSLILQQKGARSDGLRFGVTYLGLTDGQPQYRLDLQWNGNTHRQEITAPEHWDVAKVFDQLPEPCPRGIILMLETLEATPAMVRLRATSTMRLSYEGDWDTVGLDMAGTLTLPDPLRRVVNWMMRHGEVSLADVTAHTGEDEESMRALLENLVKQGIVQIIDVKGQSRYRVRLATKRERQLSDEIWQALETTVTSPARAVRALPQTARGIVTQRARELIFGERGRFVVSLSPAILALLMAEWLLVSRAGSFTWLVSFSGVVTNSLAAGIFPALLLLSSRHKGELIPDTTYRFLGHALVVMSICLLFLATLVLHALVIWQHPLARASAFIAALVIMGVIVVMVRGGAFAARIVVELREGPRPGNVGTFAIIENGHPVPAEVQLAYPEREACEQTDSGTVPEFSRLRHVTFRLSPTAAREVKVWAHRITSSGDSEAMPALAEFRCGNETRRFDLKLSGGQVVVPLVSDSCWVRIALAEPFTS